MVLIKLCPGFLQYPGVELLLRQHKDYCATPVKTSYWGVSGVYIHCGSGLKIAFFFLKLSN